MQGKVVIFIDHTPFVLIVPMTFWNGFEATGDANKRFIYITFIRILRIVMFVIAVFYRRFTSPLRRLIRN